MRQQQISSLSRLYLGAHELEIERGRFKGGARQARAQRVCKCCDLGIIEDEMHMLLECPAWQGFRQAAWVFTNDPGGEPSMERMRAVTQGSNDAMWWRQLADFTIRVEAKRRAMYREHGFK
jgi:hypothetical protein